MSKTVWRVTPVNGYDIPGLEGWLERQAAKGLLFSMTAGPLTLFSRGEPAALRFHLEPAPNKPDRLDPELNALYEQAGWRYLGLFRSSFAVFASEQLDAQAHTDPEVWDYALRRFFRRKLLAGLGLLALNFVFLSLYWGCSFSWSELRWFPVTLLSRQPVIAAALSILGLALTDLSWLLGLAALVRYRRAQKSSGHSRGGALLAAGTLILLLVLTETLWPITGLNPQLHPADDFVTLADLEGDGPDVQVNSQTRDYYNYGYNCATLFLPERWSFWQTARHRWVNGAADPTVPALKLQIYRYPLPLLAGQMVQEQSRIHHNGGTYEACGLSQRLDQVLLSLDRPDPESASLPTARLILRQGRTVLLAEYRGDQDLLQFLPRFAQVMRSL